MIQINGIYCLEGDTYITNDVRRTGTLKWDPAFQRVMNLIGHGKGRVMVDVGAYIGDSTKWFEDAGFQCHAFEPMSDAFACLVKNARPDTKCYNFAVGNGQAYTTTTEAQGNLGGRSLDIGGDTVAPTLDSLFPDGVDVLKIDAEGFEPFVLQGAKEILKRKPILILEINKEALAKFGFGPGDVLELLPNYETHEVYRFDDGQYDIVCFPRLTYAIAMPVCNRPEYTERAIKAIPLGIPIYAHVDCQKDGLFNKEVLEVLKKHDIVYEMAQDKLGCNGNVKAALELAWNSGLQPDVVVCIEDDIVVEPDAFDYIRWAANRYKHDPQYRTIGLWAHKQGWQPGRPFHPSELGKVMEQPKFSVWGWATWRDRWEEIRDRWTTGPDSHDTSWDVVMLSQLEGRKEVVPSISRANNIGELNGTHQGAVHPGCLASDFGQGKVEYWTNLEESTRKKVLVCLGRNGDNYMVAKAATEPCIIFTSQEFSPIIRELFPQHEVFILSKKVSGLAEAMQYAKSRFPNHDIRPCQQHGMPRTVQAEFRNYEEYQKWQAKQ